MTARDALITELVSLYELTERLRRECPWDRKQTQESVIAFTLEETYELADAILERRERGEDAVCAELGDLLFQVFFLACIADEAGLYDLGDVSAGIRTKLVRRHPHIFGQAKAETPDDVRDRWEEIKRGSEGREGIFHDVPDSFPSTLLAQKLQQRAAAVGFDWRHAREVMGKVHEETAEVEELLAREDGAGRMFEEVGDLLFAVVNLARKLRVDPELALRRAALRFRERVEAAASAAASEGDDFERLSLDEQEEYYQRVKKERGP